MKKEHFHVFYQIVLVTNLSKPLITDKIKNILFDYLEIKSKSMNCDIFKLDGIADHIHALMTIPPNLSISDVIENLKTSSINYINKNLNDANLSWQEGFFLTTISPEDFERIGSRLDFQTIYHMEKTREEELKNFYQV